MGGYGGGVYGVGRSLSVVASCGSAARWLGQSLELVAIGAWGASLPFGVVEIRVSGELWPGLVHRTPLPAYVRIGPLLHVCLEDPLFIAWAQDCGADAGAKVAGGTVGEVFCHFPCYDV